MSVNVEGIEIGLEEILIVTTEVERRVNVAIFDMPIRTRALNDEILYRKKMYFIKLYSVS